MKGRLYEKLMDLSAGKIFTKTNLAVALALSLVLNVGALGVAYKQRRDFTALSNVYASQREEMGINGAADEIFYSSADENKETSAAEAQKDIYNENGHQQDEIYYVSNQGTKYHVSSCSYLKKSRNKVTLAQAEKYGYTPCSRCIK